MWKTFHKLAYMKRPKRIFSESFKRDKVQQYEKGKLSVSQICRLYDVSKTSIYKWIAKYGTLPSNERVVVETESDYLKLVDLQTQIEKMERLIGAQQIAIDYHKTIIETASEYYEEDIEKKFG